MAFLSHRLYKIIWEQKGQHHSRHRKPQRPPKETHMFGTLTSIEEYEYYCCFHPGVFHYFIEFAGDVCVYLRL